MRDLEIDILSENDFVNARVRVREFVAQNIDFGPVDRLYVLTAVSGFARNIYHYAGEGKIQVSILKKDKREGIKLVFSTKKFIMTHLDKALNETHEEELSLSSAKKLADEFDIKSEEGKGTEIIWVKWKK